MSVQMGRGAGQGSVPEGSGSLRAFGGSAQGVRVSCASASSGHSCGGWSDPAGWDTLGTLPRPNLLSLHQGILG